MKLRKCDRKRLESILCDLERGLAFIMESKTAIMRESSGASCDLFSSELSNKRYVSIAKEIGSEFCLAITGCHKLKNALKEEEIL